jgi:hypothetical protein
LGALRLAHIERTKLLDEPAQHGTAADAFVLAFIA